MSNASYALESSLEKGGLKEQLTTGKGFSTIGTYWYLIYNQSNEIIEKNAPYVFKGIFDGNNKSLINLYINQTRTFEVSTLEDGNTMIEYFYEDQSLFGKNYGKICNLSLENVNITGDYNVAGICGVNFSTIENCKVNGSIKSTEFWAMTSGIAGENIGSIIDVNVNGNINGTYSVAGISIYNSKEIRNCSNEAKIYNNNGLCAAGIVGNNYEDGIIENCYNTADIKSEISQDNTIFLPKCGGIVADNMGEITKGYNTGNIIQYGYRTYAGGLAGYATGIISQSYSTGNILANGGYAARIGGLVGNAEQLTIENCYNTGNVEVEAPAKYTKIGGIIGESRTKLDMINVYNIGYVTGIGTGYLKLGALLGEINGTVTITNGFYLNTLAIQLTGTGNPTLINSGEKSEQELKDDEFILLKDYGEIWIKDNEKNNGYPILK